MTSFKIAIVDKNPARAAVLDEGLRDAGFTQIDLINDTNKLIKKIYAIDPDVILIDLENPSRDLLEQMFQVSRAVKRPIAMFVDESDAASIQSSVEAGVSPYIVDGLKKERVKAVFDLCVSRFNAFAKLQANLDRARLDLDQHKGVERAKRFLMKTKKIGEDEAYKLIRDMAMRENKKIAEIARSILIAAALLK